MAETCKFPGCHFHPEKNGYCIRHKIYASEKPATVPPETTIKKPRQKPVPKKSAKRKDQDRDYNKKRKAFLKAHTLCRAKLAPCTLIATEIHHKKGRTGANYLNEKTWMAVCHSCHMQIEQTPAASKENGHSESRLNK